jgi:hypothetical protein
MHARPTRDGTQQHGSAEWPPRSSTTDTDLPQAAGSNFSSNVPLEQRHGLCSEPGQVQAQAAADDLLHDLGGAAEDRLHGLSRRQSSQSCRRTAAVDPADQGQVYPVSACRGVRAVRSGCNQKPGDRLAPWQLPEPGRGPDDRAEPAAADIPAVNANVGSPVSSSRHSCQRSSRCTMPAMAASCGRAAASRRAAISISAGVSTLTTTA